MAKLASAYVVFRAHGKGKIKYDTVNSNRRQTKPSQKTTF